MIKRKMLIMVSMSMLLLGCEKEPAETVAQGPATVSSEYIKLDEDLGQLITYFNKYQGKVRQLFIVGPTCGVCLRGMADLDDEYIQALQNDPRLQTFVVHVPTLGAEEKDVSATMSLLDGPRISHYWDEGGRIGLDFREVLDIGMYAWDVWMLFDPDVTWDPGSLPPQPNFWQHQLGGLDRAKKLDKVVFANEAKRQIKLLPEIIEDNPVASNAAGSDTGMIPVAQPRGVIIGQHIKMRGGYRQLKSISSVKYTGTTEANDTQYLLTVETLRPNTYIRTVERDGHIVSAKWDGKAASYTHESGMVIPADIMQAMLRSYDFDGWIVEWKDKGYSLSRLGMKKMADKLPWVLQAELPDGQTWNMYIDSHTGDQFRTSLLDKDKLEKFVIEYDDFSVVEGIRMPHRVRYIKDGKLIASDTYSNIDITMTANETGAVITH